MNCWVYCVLIRVVTRNRNVLHMHTSVLQSVQVRSVDELAREFKYQNLEVHTVVALQ